MSTPENTSHTNLLQALIDMAVESWRLSRLFSRVIQKLDAGEVNRYVNQLRYYSNFLEANLGVAGLRLVNVEGHPYDPGMAATAINLGDFKPEDALIVDQMLEPIIMGTDGVIKTGTVILRRVTQ